MTPDDLRKILAEVDGAVEARAGFEDELLTLLTSELSESVANPAVVHGPSLQGLKRRWVDRLRPSIARRAAAAGIAALALLASVVVQSRDDVLQHSRPADTANPGDAIVPQGNAPADGAPGPGVAGVGVGADPSGGRPPEVPETQPDEPGGSSRPDPEPQPDRTGSESAPEVLAFAGRVDGYWHIFTMHSDGTHRQQLTHAAAHDREPTWSPDGRFIAFTRIADEGDHDGRILVMRSDGTGLRFVVDGGEPAWSPDGKHIAYTSFTYFGPEGVAPAPTSVWIVPVDGSDPRQVSPDDSFSADATWSPEGGLLTFANIAASDDTDPGESRTTNLFTLSIADDSMRRLTNTFYACNSEYSPDGGRLAFISSDGGPFRLWSMRSDGSEKVQLTHGLGTYAFPHWSPDGSHIVFALDPDGEPHWSPQPVVAGPEPGAIWSIGADGRDLVRISPAGVDEADPAFAPNPDAAPEVVFPPRRDQDVLIDEVVREAAGQSVC